MSASRLRADREASRITDTLQVIDTADFELLGFTPEVFPVSALQALQANDFFPGKGSQKASGALAALRREIDLVRAESGFQVLDARGFVQLENLAKSLRLSSASTSMARGSGESSMPRWIPSSRWAAVGMARPRLSASARTCRR